MMTNPPLEHLQRAALPLTREGQAFYHEPVTARPRAELRTPIAESLAEAFGRVRHWRDAQGMPQRERTDVPDILLGYRRVPLRWLRRNRAGELVPR